MDLQSQHALFLAALQTPLAQRLSLAEDAKTSFLLEALPLQDPFRFRARSLGKRLALYLLDDEGEIIRARLEEMRSLWRKEGIYLIGPSREGDCRILKHLQFCLEEIGENPQIVFWLRKFSLPLCHKKAELAVKETLWPEPASPLRTGHVRKAALTAWFTVLSQATGSCFASAPAILIQKIPELFFKDLYDLISTGQMKRTVGGKEYAVPFSLNFGLGDLQKKGKHIPFSFGFRFALHAVGMELTSSIQEKISDTSTVEQALETALFDALQLTPEDLIKEKRWEEMQLSLIAARQGAIFYQKPSELSLKVAEWKKKSELSKLAFRSLTECSLLRAWEYSLASFSDVKTEFARWNLSIGLGLDPKQPGGVGHFLYEKLSSFFEKAQREIQEIEQSLVDVFQSLQNIRSLFETGGGGSKLERLKAEWSAQNLHFESLTQRKEHLVRYQEALSQFFPFLIARYDELLQGSFQELFDPAIQAESTSSYDDGAAGFRLVYKHGRSDASQWTAIYDAIGYIEALRDFFSSVENQIVCDPHLGASFFSNLTTSLIQFIQEPSFLSSALERVKKEGRRSPWDYVSGGTLSTLLATYFSREKPFKELSCIPHSAEELLEFLRSVQSPSPLLIHSPTHAFIFHPSLLQKQKETPPKRADWSEEEREWIAHAIARRLSPEFRPLYLHRLYQKIKDGSSLEFYQTLLQALGEESLSKRAVVEAEIYEKSRLFPREQAEGILRRFFGPISLEEAPFFSPFDLFTAVKNSLLKKARALFPLDQDLKIIETLRQAGLCSRPLLFADTNWSDWSFGWIFHPVTEERQLWRLNRIGLQGYPMTEWTGWLSAQNEAPWVILYPT